MNELKMVVFDMAGTTVKDNHEVEDCFAMAARDCGIEMSEGEIKSVQGWSKRYVFESYWKKHYPENSLEFIERVNYSFDRFKEILENHYQTHSVYPTEGCLEIFDYLKQNNIRIALTTGFYRKVTSIILNKLGWLEGLDSNYVRNTDNSVIDISVASDEVLKGRPAPDMILYCMQAFQIDNPNQVIAIGDTPSDIESGRAANCIKTIALSNGTHSSQQLQHHNPDIILESMLDFPTYLKSKGFLP
jgi:phosphonatase-like hydrolase